MARSDIYSLTIHPRIIPARCACDRTRRFHLAWVVGIPWNGPYSGTKGTAVPGRRYRSISVAIGFVKPLKRKPGIPETALRVFLQSETHATCKFALDIQGPKPWP
jgi:hypothetical protein